MANTQNQLTKRSTNTSRKKLKKLRSIKVANLHRLRVSMRRSSSRINDRHRLIALSVHGEETFDGVQECWPRYMMATSSSSARIESSLAGSGTKAAKSLKRVTSSKRFRRMTSLRSRRSSSGGGIGTTALRERRKEEANASSMSCSSASEADAILLNNGSELEKLNAPENGNAIVREAVKLKGKLEKSRSIKLTRIRSMRSSRKQLKIRLGQASDSISEDTRLNGNHEKSARTPPEKWSMKPPKFLAKLPSLSRRSTVKKRIDTRKADRATCSSTLKSSKMSEHLELHSGGCESNGTSAIHVCPYSYCSLNGHYHAPLPPLSAFISAKRQSLRTKNMDKKNEVFSFESGPSSKTTSTASEWLEEYIAASFKDRSVSEPGFDEEVTPTPDSDMELNETDCKRADLGSSSSGFCKTIMEQDGTTSSLVLPETPREISSLNGSASRGTNILSDDGKYTKLWRLMYQHVLSTKGEQTETEQDNEVNEDEIIVIAGNDIFTSRDSANTNDESSEKNVDEESYRPELEQLKDFTIKLVQAAVDDILAIHKMESPQQSMTTLDHDAVKGNKKEQDAIAQDDTDQADVTCTANKVEVESSEKKPPKETTANGYRKLKKLIASMRFIKCMEKPKKINAHKQQYLPRETNAEPESVYLKRTEKDERNNMEEWMLDYALRKVIAKLGPAEQRRVALLTEAFETFAPEPREINASHPMRTKFTDKAASAIRKQEEGGNSFVYDIAKDDVAERPDDNDDAICGNSLVETAVQEVHEAIPSSPSEQLSNKRLEPNDAFNLHTQNQESQTVCLICDLPRMMNGKAKMDSEPKYEALKQESRENHPKHNLTNIDKKGTLLNKQDYTSLWHLIYLHAQSGINAEAGSQLQEVETIREQKNGHSIFSKGDTEAHGETLDSEVERRIELTQSDTIQLVKEALEGILLAQNLSSENKSCLATTNLYQQFPNKYQDIDQSSDASTISASANDSLQKEKDQEDSQIDPDNESFSTDSTIPIEDYENASPPAARLESKAQQGYSKVRKAILCNKFIKAMEKTQKLSWQKRRVLPTEPDFEEENVSLRRCLINQKKNSEEWMLDYALQQAIAKLDPDKQRRVALIARAFEAINPDLGGRREGNHATRAIVVDSDSSDDNADGKKLDQMHGIHDLNLKQDRSQVPHIMKEQASRVQFEASGVGKPCLDVNDNIKVNEQVGNNVSEMTTSLNDGEKPTSNKVKILQVSFGDQLQDLQTGSVVESGGRITAIGYVREIDQPEDCKEASDLSAQIENFRFDDDEVSAKSDGCEINCNIPAQIENTEDPLNASTEEKDCEDPNDNLRSDTMMGTSKYRRMWRLIYKHARSDILEKMETQLPGSEIDVHSILNDTNQAPEKCSDGSQSLSEADCETVHEIPSSGSSYTGVQQQKQDIIMLVQKAVEEILVIQEQTCIDQLATDKTNSDKEARSCISDSDGVATLREEKDMPTQGSDNSGELSSTTYKNFSQVILVKRFIKAMEKVRKLNRWRARHISQKPQKESECVHLKHHALGERRSCEDWMLDYALQEVIGKLAPVQRKRVAMLVEAFETVSPLPALETHHRVNVAAS